MVSNFNRAVSMTMAMVSALSTITPALAASQVSGDGQSVPVELTVEKPTFSVTVPTGLPVAVDADGKVYCSTKATIKNNTFGQVKVSNVTIEGNSPWTVAAWDLDMQKEKVNTAKIAMQLNGGNTIEAGYAFEETNFPIMDGHGSMPLTYDAKLPAQTKVISGDTIANVVFTVGWNTSDESIPLNGITLDQQNMTLNKGSEADLHVVYDPENTTDPKEVQWSSNHSDIVSVVDGHLVAKDWGEATITATVGEHNAQCVVTVPKILNGITLSEHDITMENGTQHQLNAETKYRETPVWSVIEGSCVTVDNGLITATAPGTAKIQVQMGEFTDTCTVHVTQRLNGISLNKSATTINMGSKETLSVIYNPNNTTESKTVTWSVISGSAVRVSNGVVTPVAPGKATVQAKVGSYTATCEVTVKAPLKGISLNKTSMYLNMGSTGTLSVSYNPSNTTDPKGVTWSVISGSAVKVSDGVVTPLSPGKATVQAKVGSHTATCAVTVEAPLQGILMNKSSTTLKNGQSETLYVNFNPSNTTDSKYVSWSVSPSGIIDVKNGTITPIADTGSAVVTAQVGRFKTTCTVMIDDGRPHSTNNPIDLDMMDDRLATLTGTITFSREKAPSYATVPMNRDNSVMAYINGQNATIYSRDGGGVAAPEDSGDMFVYLTNMGYRGYKAKTLNVDGLDTSNVTSMFGMFANVEATTISGLGSFNTTKVDTMNAIFNACKATVLDLSSFDLSNVRDCQFMLMTATCDTVYCRTLEDKRKMINSGQSYIRNMPIGKPPYPC